MEKPKSKDSGFGNSGKNGKATTLEVPDPDINLIQQGSNSLLVVISKKAMKMMQAGYSYPLEMVKGERKIKFIIVEKETFDKQALAYGEKILRERAGEIENIGKGLVNEKVDPRKNRKGN